MVLQVQDYYKTLGVEKSATQEDIKKAFRKLAKQHHPDARPGDKAAEETFKRVSEAYEVLGNEQRRKEYDELRSNIGNASSFDPSRYGYGQGRGFEGFGGSTVFSGGGFSDFFEMLFGRGQAQGSPFGGFGQGGAAYANHGQDAETDIELTVEEAFRGVKKRISLEQEGRRKTIEFTVPPGTGEGERIRLQGQGSARSGGTPGDLYLNVRLAKGLYTLQGLDLTADIRLTPWEAALGAKVPFETLDGGIVVKVPPGVQSDSRIRIAKKGFQNRQGQRGDLYLTVKLVNPPTLTAEEKKLYEQLAKVSKFKAMS